MPTTFLIVILTFALNDPKHGRVFALDQGSLAYKQHSVSFIAETAPETGCFDQEPPSYIRTTAISDCENQPENLSSLSKN